MPEPGGELLTNSVSGIVGTHDIILQSLDAWRPYQKPDGSYETRFYGSDVFEGTEKDWETVPVILGQSHPDTPYTKDPTKAIAEAKGAVIGNLSDVIISKDGSPVLKSKLHLSDPKAESLLKSGKLALSTGFLSGITEGRLTGVSGKIIPDHVLAFEHSRTNRPQDGAALILNNSGVKKMTDEVITKSVLTDFLAELKAILIPNRTDPPMPAIPEKPMVANMSETRITELEKTVAEQAELIKNQTAELDQFKESEKARKAAELEAKWQSVKNSTPPGLYATPEMEAKARGEWEADPTTFLIQNAINQKKPETAEDGVPYVKNSVPEVKDESDEAYEELYNATRGMR